MAKQRKMSHIGTDAGEYARRRMASDPELAAGVLAELGKLQLARQVKQLRESRHLSQAELAAKVGTKQPAIARLESGRGIPRLDFLQRIADALGARLDVRLSAAHRQHG
jgi:ribosome-binding protein aMBF1 (putative translation factor)